MLVCQKKRTEGNKRRSKLPKMNKCLFFVWTRGIEYGIMHFSFVYSYRFTLSVQCGSLKEVSPIRRRGIWWGNGRCSLTNSCQPNGILDLCAVVEYFVSYYYYNCLHTRYRWSWNFNHIYGVWEFVRIAWTGRASNHDSSRSDWSY